MNRDQREVLLYMREGDVLIDDFAWTQLMTSMRGGSGPRRKGEPEHSVSSYECRSGKITAKFFDGTEVTITRATVRKYVTSLEPDLLDRLRDTRATHRAESRRTSSWCMCPEQRGEGKCMGGMKWEQPRYHPTDDEYDKHVEVCYDLREDMIEALAGALHLLPEPQPGEQLELFA